MSVEQVARDYVTKMSDPEEIKGFLTTEATVSGGVLPQPVPAMEAIQLLSALTTAIPDMKFDVQQVTVIGSEATVNTLWGGTQTAPLSLPMPGMPTLPPTGKKVSVKDTYVLMIQGDKVSHMRIDSPADGGIPAALGQLGVKMPGM